MSYGGRRPRPRTDRPLAHDHRRTAPTSSTSGQLAPRIWDAVRRGVDRERGLRGGWILTGSSSPLPRRGVGAGSPPTAGRAASAGSGCAPLTLSESGGSTRGVSLARPVRGRVRAVLRPGRTPWSSWSSAAVAGWPGGAGHGHRLRPGRRARVPAPLLHGDRPARRQGTAAWRSGPSRRSRANLGQAATYRTLVRDMYGEDEDPSTFVAQETAASYLALLRSSLPRRGGAGGGVPQARSRKRLAHQAEALTSPTPSLAAASWAWARGRSCATGRPSGSSSRTSACATSRSTPGPCPGRGSSPSATTGMTPARGGRDRGARGRAVGPPSSSRSVKDKVEAAEESLLRLRRKLCENPRARVREPEFLAVVTGVSRYARRTPKGVYVLPVRCLTA